MSPEDNARAIKQLELLQAIIARMAQNSFVIKGWAVTLSSALLALNGKDSNKLFALLAFLPAATFWGLDAYYLMQERIFRAKYEEAASALKMSLGSKPSSEERTWGHAFLTRVVYLPYVVIMVVAALVALRGFLFGAQ